LEEASSCCALSTESAFGSGLSAFGARTPSTGFAPKPRWRASQRNQPRQADSTSASVRGASPFECSSAT